jgi:orotate phosphoribosyltransferase-like protein
VCSTGCFCRRTEAGLTKREQDKADLIEAIKTQKARGLNNTQIAKELAVSRVYVSRLINSKV